MNITNHKLWCVDQGHFNEDQALFVSDLVEKQGPEYCLETGFCTGRSALSVLLSTSTIKKFISIDIDFGGFVTCHAGRKYKSLIESEFPRFKGVQGSSDDILQELFFTSEYPSGIDWFMVDGDHSYNGCFTDIERAIPYMNDGGIIIIDDYNSGPPNGWVNSTVAKACDDILIKHKSKLSKSEWNKLGKGFCIFTVGK
jgi:predicted O-methyltransferase YrrM